MCCCDVDVEELTRDHHPDRDDERTRIEAAGGFVRLWGVPRVNGILVVSRSIGDVYSKRYGVSPVPEVIGWRHLTANDCYLVVASDGIFKSLKPQKVCDLLWDANVQVDEMSKSSCSCSSSSSLADRIVNKAFKKGSRDNLSAVVIPLNFIGFPQEPAGQNL
ncbi:probable protein phosphatase 2C 51 [Camellia sinensis]|uniref:probable protein phosphatase 2C 51 n=1 Tax=Camellia sinensis TaxID=4442 RepID=UPI0010359C00|nr:probable protein phosphatase 2C 51 [Camellia sinensis]